MRQVFINLVAFLAAVSGVYSIEAHANSIQQMEGVAARATSLRAFLSSPALIEDYRKAVEGYYGTARFNCQSYREVIDELRALSKRVPAVAESLWRPWDYKNSILVLTQDGNAFNFKAVPRKLHTLWSYASENQCENEVCTSLFVEGRNKGTVLLGRWASTIAGSQVQLIEKNGKYSGMALLLTPYKKDKKTFGLVDAYGDRNAITERLPVMHARSGKTLETSLLNAWLEKISAAKPEWLAGFIVPAISSSPKGIALAQAFSPRKLTPQMDQGFLPVDPLAKTISQHLAKQCGVSETVATGLKPAVGDSSGGYFQVAVAGDGSFAKFSGSLGSGYNIFGGEINANGVTQGPNVADAKQINPKSSAPKGAQAKSNFGLSGASGNGLSNGTLDTGVSGNGASTLRDGNAAAGSSFNNPFPDSQFFEGLGTGVSPSTHARTDSGASPKLEGAPKLGAFEANGRNPNPVRDEDLGRDTASLPNTSSNGGKATDAQPPVGRGGTSPASERPPVVGNASAPESTPRPSTNPEGIPSIGGGIAAGIGNAIEEGSRGALNPTEPPKVDPPVTRDPPIETPPTTRPPIADRPPIAENPPIAEKPPVKPELSPLAQIAEEFKKDKPEVSPETFKRAIEDASRLGDEKAVEQIQAQMGEVLRNSDGRLELAKALGEVRGKESIAFADQLALHEFSACGRPKLDDILAGSDSE